MPNLAINLDRFSSPLSTEYASHTCAYCGDSPCTCYTIGDDWREEQERMEAYIDDSYDSVGEPT